MTTTLKERAGICGGCGVYTVRGRDTSLVVDLQTELARLLCPACRVDWLDVLRNLLRDRGRAA